MKKLIALLALILMYVSILMESTEFTIIFGAIAYVIWMILFFGRKIR